MPDTVNLTLSHKINRLFAVMHPRSAPERSTESVAEQVAEALNRAVTPDYLEQLRDGRVDQDGADTEVLAAVASCFGVAPCYLTTAGPAAAGIDRELELLATMRDANVASIALRGSAIDRSVLAAVVREVDDTAGEINR
ncbi:hypothetical protein IU433_10855 [Nocardia puris]|uniref:Helix-turn-helix protein n=1 Tax=Nocardia puris TaxID=208602 RepID=A0A366DQZ8_9NOCA|nr:hypothetical protein [Nocardia puris]MBF6211010.1 hypothetical protein [Nocardia puris]MBF6364606.1 hypothetical protein [Nocardia puris]MBF6459535.1 hypothetical protein [Nocardia puris]RBO92502.1 hypothetical protein DFR74_103145 [Nocardia puris]